MTHQNNGVARELVRDAGATTPYSAATRFGELVFTSGALAINQHGEVASDFKTQVAVALENLHQTLLQAGADWSTVLKINAYVADIEQLPDLNEVYVKTLEPHGLPARTTVEVTKFRREVLVEFDAIAYRLEKDETK